MGGVMDKALVFSAVFLVIIILGGVYHFIRIGLFSTGLEKRQAGIISGAIMAAAGVFIYRTFFT